MLTQNHYVCGDLTQVGGVYHLCSGQFETLAGYCRDDVIYFLEQSLETKGSPL